MNILLSLSVAILAGLLMTRVFKPLRLPSVTAYLVAGILVGPYCLGKLGLDGLGFVTMDAVNKLSIVSDVALGFIAFSIGNEFRLSSLKKPAVRQPSSASRRHLSPQCWSMPRCWSSTFASLRSSALIRPSSSAPSPPPRRPQPH